MDLALAVNSGSIEDDGERFLSFCANQSIFWSFCEGAGLDFVIA
jgi:hypothetical protein